MSSAAIGRSLAVAVSCSLLISARADAGAAGVACSRPFVFSGAAVNVVFLPYRYAGTTLNVTQTSLKLSALAQVDTLFSIVKYGSVGAVQLTVSNDAEDRQCTADIVARKLLGQQTGAAATLAPGRSAVLAWGRFYEEAGQTYVQTYVRIIGNTAAVDAMNATIGGHEFRGRLSSTGFAFAPRVVSSADLDQIQRRAMDTLKLYTQPDPSSPSKPMRVDLSEPIVYSVTEVRGEWMQIKGYANGLSGWVRGDVSLSEWSLRGKMPEFVFIEGIVGFLKARSGSATSDATAQRLAVGTLRRTIDEFNATKTRIASPAPLALAVGKQMMGMLLLRADAPADDLTTAVSSFSGAASLVPYSADAVNLELMARLMLAAKQSGDAGDARAYIDRWTQALGREPGNVDALNNFQAFLEWLDADAGRTPRAFRTAPEPDDVRKWLAAARAVPRPAAGGGS
jgi:hypothetical protein